ncbi:MULTISPECIES: hypothetical protein [unclassified Myroides]|uniref:hypothetical protein n=1 Tax=unclassified Myroides TaxID=2642485 RepID=UPI003D2F5B93
MKKGIIIVLVVVAVAVLQFSHFMKSQPSKVEVRQTEAIDFVVDKIEVSSDGAYMFYDAKGVLFTHYTFDAPAEIIKGDRIVQEANATELYVYRFDQNGNKKLFLKVNRK